MTEESRKLSLVLDSPSAILSRIRNLASLPVDSAESDVSGEWVSVLTRTDWLQILLLRYTDDPDKLKIEVEVFMPADAPPEERSIPQRQTPLDMIAHMEYLIRLQDVGFSLQMVGEECLWVASKEFDGIPENEVLEALVPPSTGR